MFEVDNVIVYKGDVVVEYTNGDKVMEGKRYNISPSQGYMGITRGYVDVISIVDEEGVVLLDKDDIVLAGIEAHKDATLSLYTDRDNNPDSADYYTIKEHLDSTIWVAYQYPHNNNGEDDSVYVLPIEEFVDHTSLF